MLEVGGKKQAIVECVQAHGGVDAGKHRVGDVGNGAPRNQPSTVAKKYPNVFFVELRYGSIVENGECRFLRGVLCDKPSLCNFAKLLLLAKDGALDLFYVAAVVG